MTAYECKKLCESGYLKPIGGYEGLYLIGRKGEVISLKYNGGLRKKPYIMVGAHDKHGYKIVCLSDGKRIKTKRVHRLVAIAFLPNPNNYREINHKDENTSNCDVNNLEWCTRKYNVNYGNRTQKTRKRVDQYTIDGKFVKTHDGVREAAKEVGARFQSISACCYGKYKTSCGYLWRWHI